MTLSLKSFEYPMLLLFYIFEYLAIADPALGNISFDEQRFKDIWENNTLFLINVAPEHRKKFLALQDSDLRHVEDATVNRYAFVDLQYPQFYMDKIADKASTIRLDKNLNEESENFGKPTYNFLRLYYKSK